MYHYAKSWHSKTAPHPVRGAGKRKKKLRISPRENREIQDGGVVGGVGDKLEHIRLINRNILVSSSLYRD